MILFVLNILFFLFKEKGLEKSPLSEHFLIKTRKISPPPNTPQKNKKQKTS